MMINEKITWMLAFIIMLTGCTTISWEAPDGTSLSGYSLLSNKHLEGSFQDGNRLLIIKELEEDQVSGVAAITKAAVEGAVKGLKP